MFVLLATEFVKRPMDFSVFPYPLLRLGPNVASTGLVLCDAYAGEDIAAFEPIAVSGSLNSGCVIF